MAEDDDERRAGPSTRQRILKAAIQRFAAAPYEQVSLREIASDVGVDVAYVHRSFGSKDALFSEALQVSAGPEILSQVCDADFVPAFVHHLFEKDGQRDREAAGPMDILIHSLASPKASGLLRAKVESDFLDPLSERLHDRSRLRASMFVAVLLGFGIARDLLRLEPLAAGREEDVEAAIRSTLQSIVDADLDRS